MTPQDMAIADDRVNGATLQKIANDHGMNVSTACRKLQKPELRAYLEEIQERLIHRSLEASVENIAYAVDYYRSPGEKVTVSRKDGSTCQVSQKNEQLMDHGYKASVKICESVGILPSHTQSQVIVNILNQGTVQISPAITRVLQQIFQSAPVSLPDLGLEREEKENGTIAGL